MNEPSLYIDESDSESDDVLIIEPLVKTMEESLNNSFVEPITEPFVDFGVVPNIREGDYTMLEQDDKVPAEIPAEVHKEIPAEVHKEIPAEVPTEILKEIPTEILKEIPAEVHKEIPAEILKEIPTEILKEIPTEILKEIPTEILKEIPTEILKEVPAEILKEVPKEINENLEKYIKALDPYSSKFAYYLVPDEFLVIKEFVNDPSRNIIQQIQQSVEKITKNGTIDIHEIPSFVLSISKIFTSIVATSKNKLDLMKILKYTLDSLLEDDVLLFDTDAKRIAKTTIESSFHLLNTSVGKLEKIF